MNKKIIYLSTILLLLAPASALAGEMDLFLRSMVNRGVGASWSKVLPEDAGEVLVPCFVKTADVDVTRLAIETAGGDVGIVVGDIITARIPVESLSSIAARSEIHAVEFGSPLSSKMDTARAAGEVVVVQDGSALGVPYEGTNVVVGIVDDAIDYGHPDFGGASANTRVQYLKQVVGGETLECTKRSIADGSCEIVDEGQGYTHGTHVTGIAAGGDDVYTGVAPKADIMFVFLNVEDASTSGTAETSFATNVLESAAQIFSKADLMDKPAVVNLSLGTSLGAHDGTSLLEQGLTELTADSMGRIIVGAAGNEQVVPVAQPVARRNNVGGIHASVNVSDGQSRASRIGIWSGAGSASTYVGGTLVDLWLTSGQKDNCSVSVFGYTQGRSSQDFTFPALSSTGDATLSVGDIAFSEDSSSTATSDSGSVTVSSEIDDSDIRNEKPHAMIVFSPTSGSSGSSLETFWYDIVVRASGGDCNGHMWLYYDYTSFHDFLTGISTGAFDVADGAEYNGYALVDGDSFYTMTIPATSNGVIAAGSWLAEKPTASGLSEWTGLNGNTYDQSNINSPGGSGSTVDDLSAFSSLGPTADGRTKPEIVAPGEPIISAKARGSSVSTSIAVDEYYYKSAGTSMASPYVTGVVALLLERNNTLTTDEVRELIGQGAVTDGLVSKTTDSANSYGSGKIDAAAILAAVEADNSAYSGTGDLESPGGGCAIVCTDNKMNGIASLIFIIMFSSLFVTRIYRCPFPG